LRIAGGGGIALVNSTGNAWTGDYLKITGELDVDLRSNIAAESRAKIVYERLINYTDDPGTIDTLQFLMTREITHLKAFSAALESLEKSPFSIGRLAVTPGIVNEYFNASTGDGDEGDTDMHGPWHSSFGLHPVESQMNGGKGLSVGAIDGIAGREDRGKQDAGKKATTATDIKTVDPKRVPNNTDAMQTGKQATSADEKAVSANGRNDAEGVGSRQKHTAGDDRKTVAGAASHKKG
jgi:Mn-containing catalase